MFPLQGVRVLDLSRIVAGPLCTQYLGELGAEVIKVETPTGGDDTRSWPPMQDGVGAAFLAFNCNKQSIAVDLKNPEGLSIVRKLAKTAQVMIESFNTGVAQRLKVDYESVRADNPSVVYCSISGYGRTGPLGKQPGYDLMAQAYSGIMSLTGEKNGNPIRSPFSPLDQTTGIHAVVGILSGLMNCQRTGKGSYMEVSLFETGLAFLGYNAQSYWIKGVVPERSGSGHESLCPYQAFQASDGYLLLGVGNDNLWRKFCGAASLEHVQDDPKFRSNADRVSRFDETVSMVAEVIRRRTVGEWMEAFQAAGVPCSPINTLDTVLAHPQTLARNMVMDYVHPYFGPQKATPQPIMFGGKTREVLSAPPLLGQHTEEVLGSLNYAPEEVRRLHDQGIIFANPKIRTSEEQSQRRT